MGEPLAFSSRHPAPQANGTLVIYRVGSKKESFGGSVPIARDLLSRKTKQVVMQLQDKVPQGRGNR